jgi:hypothetical protein
MEQTITLIGIAAVLVAGLIFSPRMTLSLIGRLISGTFSLLADAVALIFTWV